MPPSNSTAKLRAPTASSKRAAFAASEADLVIALGSTLSVQPAATFPLVAAQNGARYIIINLGPTDHDGLRAVQLRIDADVAVVFPPAVVLLS